MSSIDLPPKRMTYCSRAEGFLGLVDFLKYLVCLTRSPSEDEEDEDEDDADDGAIFVGRACVDTGVDGGGLILCGYRCRWTWADVVCGKFVRKEVS